MKKKQPTLVVQVKVKKDMLRDYLRFRRALRRIARTTTEDSSENGLTAWAAIRAVRRLADEALGKGKNR